jgi:hypothetical protein
MLHLCTWQRLRWTTASKRIHFITLRIKFDGKGGLYDF